MTSILDRDIIHDYDEEMAEIVSSLATNTELDSECEVSLCQE